MDEILSQAILTRTPSAFGKIGGTEGKAITFANKPVRKIIKRNRYNRYRNKLYFKSGVFPNSNRIFDKFITYFTQEVLPEMDGLCNWRGKSDDQLAKAFAPKAQALSWESLEIGGMTKPSSWIGSLANQRVQVITSLVNTIEAQRKRLDSVWPEQPWMHCLKNVQSIECPQYAHLTPPVDKDWFAALARLCETIDNHEYDVCIIGAGAWSLPLAVHAKKRGKVGIHMGGALQLMFGIKGNRWISGDRINHVLNPSWTYPFKEDTPPSFEGTEDAAYWEKADNSS